jgi:hypothetical protein
VRTKKTSCQGKGGKLNTETKMVETTTTFRGVNNKKVNGLPDFLVIGAGKSGTTSLDKYLNQHPEVFVPKSKEPNFFGYENMKLEDFDNEDDINHFKNSVTTLEAYLKIFDDAKPNQIKGETSNT